jgi:capsular exopolysaccharide synthesis family protein
MQDEFEMDFSVIFSVIRHWFLLILLFIMLGGSIAVFYNYSAPIKYESTVTLYVQPQVNESEVDYQGLLTNQKMVQSYSAMLKTRTVIVTTIETLGLDLTYEEFISMLSISSDTDTQMIKATIKDTDKYKVADIANALATTFIDDIALNMGITNIKVVDPAIEPDTPVEPKTKLNFVIGIFGGLIIGLVLSFLLETMNHKIKTHEDVKKYLKVKTLGIIPHNSIDNEMKDKKKVYVKPGETNIRILTEPNSVVSESVRMIRTNLNFSDLKLVNVTSTMPSEGKSELITNLAASFALLDKKVLIVDCDLRKPKVHKNFGLPRNIGVSDIVLSKGTLDYHRAVQTYSSEKTTIDVLTAGSKISNPSELINSKYFAKMLDQIREDYDFVLIDCPPISSMTDGVLVSKLCDGTVYVIESDRIDYPLIQNCMEELKNNKAFILGVVLTKVDIKREKKIYGYKYDYYYSNYSKQ